MKRQINLHNQAINYTVRRSKRTKRIRFAVYCDGNFVVTVPRFLPLVLIDKYLNTKSKWIVSKINFFEKLNEKQKLSKHDNGYAIHRNEAVKIITKRVVELNDKHLGFKFNKITIRNQKTRWGSCSTKRNLNFNYRLMFLSAELRDYIIIHELCHLKEFNHSSRYWKLVESVLPNYKDCIAELTAAGINLN